MQCTVPFQVPDGPEGVVVFDELAELGLHIGGQNRPEELFDMVNLLTGGGPGSITEVASITLKREAFESWRTGPSSAFAIILFVAVFGLANIYVKALNRVKQR